MVAVNIWIRFLQKRRANRWHQSPLGGAAADCSAPARAAARVADDVSRYASGDPVCATYLPAGLSTKSGSSLEGTNERRFSDGDAGMFEVSRVCVLQQGARAASKR